jgi:lipopolysaccharide transport system ATP-binding protein
MASDVVVRIEEVSKKFRLRRDGYGDGLRHVLQNLAIQPLRIARHRLRAPQRLSNEAASAKSLSDRREDVFWALQDVSFEVKRGEVMGIIGRNGAGKSTLLKIISRISEPTKGRIGIKGRVASLLEVGTGFHPDLTGRENVYLNGAILGMSRTEIKRQFDEIIEFAGVQKFLDTPVKRYSSGMFVRLAFAVAAHLDPEILIVDEVLAVGDTEFQKKCLGKMKQVVSSGERTVFFVSHHLASVTALCSQVCLLQSGRLLANGPAKEIVELYQRQTLSHVDVGKFSEAKARPGRGTLRMHWVKPMSAIFDPASEKKFLVRIITYDPRETSCELVFYVFNEEHQTVFVADGRHINMSLTPGGTVDVTVTIRSPWMRPGEYRIDAFVWSHGIIDKWEDACRFGVSHLLPYEGSINERSIGDSLVLPDFSMEVSPVLSESDDSRRMVPNTLGAGAS